MTTYWAPTGAPPPGAQSTPSGFEESAVRTVPFAPTGRIAPDPAPGEEMRSPFATNPICFGLIRPTACPYTLYLKSTLSVISMLKPEMIPFQYSVAPAGTLTFDRGVAPPSVDQ